MYEIDRGLPGEHCADLLAAKPERVSFIRKLPRSSERFADPAGILQEKRPKVFFAF
ncbi:hypothetical protein ACFU5O_25215 [Streptomyces sp. NPDC057445]|uniref:hypothetical protein n=1 Tax=Streptomyces sp. NPDC057445 TaxID=3346136 RepID=UPI00369282C3